MKEPSFISEPERPKSNLSRRNFLAGATLHVGAAAYGAKLLHDYNDPPNEIVRTDETITVPESVEVMPRLQSENFDRWKTGYQAWWVMPYHSVVFVDEHNEPVAPPIAFQDFIVPRPKMKNGKEVMEDYALRPGAVDEFGFLTDNLASEWLRHVRPLVAEKYGVDEEKLELKHVTEEFETALNDSGDEMLIVKIRNGEISRVLDIMHYYADIPASQNDSRDKISYIEEELIFSEPGITPLMATELRSLVPALCAKESLFKDRKKNTKGAQGIAQFKSEVWDKLGLGEYGESQPFIRQVEAIGLQFGQYYRELVSNERMNAILTDTETLFVSRESYEKHCLVPLLINSYNAGAGRMKEVIKTFMTQYSIEELRERYAPIDGMDLFFAMSQFAVRSGVGGYGSDASQYVGYIYGLRDVLQAERRKEEVQLASKE